MGAQLMVEVMDFAPQGTNASLWRTLMAFARFADDETRIATFGRLVAVDLPRYINAESLGGTDRRMSALADKGLLRRTMPPSRSDGSHAFKLPRYGKREHLAPRDVMSEPAVVYHLYGTTGAVLYIGVTHNPRVRFEQHSSKPWWPEVDGVRTGFRWYPTRTEAETVETRQIQQERPPYNRTDIPTPRRRGRY